jgi:histidinol phosphatase-like PHP family hydrolase
VLKNVELAELLARAAETTEGHRQRALRRASRAAYTWSEEASDLLADGRSLGELTKIGPWLATLIKQWLGDPPDVPEPPPLRQGFISFADALATVAANPDWKSGLRGDLQMHTEHSDGSVSVAEMALTSAENGFEYVAITDHSQGLKIAGGMNRQELEAELAEIDVLNSELDKSGSKFRILRSLEMNINPRGEGDMEPEELADLDLVLGSFHSSLRTKDDQTDRYLAAVRNPHFQVFGHPRCRMFNFRLGLSCDWERVFKEAVEHDKAFEINAHPNRQDLNVELLEIARDVGVRLSIGTDAHAQSELKFIWVGVAAAIKAGIERERIINYMSADDLVAWAQGGRSAGK